MGLYMQLLGEELGKGAHGKVYKGLDQETGMFVAVKEISLEKIAQGDLASITVSRAIMAECVSYYCTCMSVCSVSSMTSLRMHVVAAYMYSMAVTRNIPACKLRLHCQLSGCIGGQWLCCRLIQLSVQALFEGRSYGT